MESLVKCISKTCCRKDFDTKREYRQMTGTISVLFGLLDLFSDVAVVIYWYAIGNYSWATLMLLSILFTNCWSMYKYSKEIYPWKTTAIMSFFGLLNVRILTRFWSQLDQESHFRKLMDARLVEVLLESIPCAIVQTYAIILINRRTVDEFLVVLSCFISILNLAYGLRNWYKFSIVSGDSADFKAEIRFNIWYIWLELFCFFDFITRAGSLALFLAVEQFRPISLVAAPLGLFLLEFILDVWDNSVARRSHAWCMVFSRGLSVALVSLGSGFMFILFAESKFIAKLEIFLRYIISVGIFIAFFNDHNNKATIKEKSERAWWDYAFPIACGFATIFAILVFVKESSMSDDDRRRTTTYFRGQKTIDAEEEAPSF